MLAEFADLISICGIQLMKIHRAPFIIRQAWFAGLLILLAAGLNLEASENWWSLRPLVRPQLPKTTIDDWSDHPVDLFIARKLSSKGLSPSPTANSRQLLRRVCADVWGLPPTAEDLEWLNRQGIERGWAPLVDRLLASPHYGERWARHWMDVIHFAETHGHDEDAPREHAWHYRDYLIESFNKDKPYAQFAQEQIAGDVMQPKKAESLIGTGFLAAGPWDESSQMGIQDGTIDKKVAQYLDRDDMITTTMSTFMGLTVHCARCHDHKFDPISIEDYYSLQAVFSGVDRHNRAFDKDNSIHVQRQNLLHVKTELLANRYPDSVLLNKESLSRVNRWVESRQHVLNRWKSNRPTFTQDSATAGIFNTTDQSIFLPESSTEKGVIAWTIESPYSNPTAIQLEVLPDERLPQKGPGWASDGNFRLSEFRVFSRVKEDQPWVQVELANPQNDFSEHTTSVRYLIDGDEKTDWGILPQFGLAHRCYFEIKESPEIIRGNQIKIELSHQHGKDHWIGRCRVSLTDIPANKIQPFLPSDLEEAFTTSEKDRSQSQLLTLSRQATLEFWDQKLESLPSPSQVYAVTSYFPSEGNFKPSLGPREVHKLARGSIHSPKEIVLPGTLSELDHIPWNSKQRNLGQEGERRLALAEWISHPKNGLFWRTMANRVWQYHFGSPLAGTPNDLGHSGSQPTHPDLLDWLACELRDSGGSLKHLHRIILNSQTYKQDSKFNPNSAATDAGNQYYWRVSPRRMDAETFRDTLLALSDSLNKHMGGPSVKQFHMKPGIHVTPVVDYEGFDPDAPAMSRRSIYRFLFRTLPDPFMQAMDCPDASIWTPKRTVSVGPLQALALMNDAFVIHQSKRLAELISNKHDDLESRVISLFKNTLLRLPTQEESELFTHYVEKHGLANACRYLFNSNLFVFIE